VATAAGIRPVDLAPTAVTLMTKNLSLHGNCLGLTSDLDHALRDYAAGALQTVTDSVFSGEDTVAAFFNRTYNDKKRFGKVVFAYRR